MKLHFCLVVCFSTLAGCASQVHRGVVAMKLDNRTAHVGIGEKEVAAGDHVELYKDECPVAGERGPRKPCKKVSYGHGTVVDILNADYSVVEFPEGTKFSEGDTIEKHAH